MRRNLTQLFFMLVLSMLLFACKKDKTNNRAINLKATVYDIKTKMPMPGVKVYLNHCLFPGMLQATYSGEIYPIPYYYPFDIDSTISDNQGKIDFQYTPVLHDGRYTTPHYFIFDSSLFRAFSYNVEICDDTNKDSLFVEAKRFLTVDMQKINPSLPNDSVTQHVSFLPHSFTSVNTKTWIGTPTTRKFFYLYPGVNKVIVEWYYFNASFQNSGKDTFDLLPNGTNVVIAY